MWLGVAADVAWVDSEPPQFLSVSLICRMELRRSDIDECCIASIHDDLAGLEWRLGNSFSA